MEKSDVGMIGLAVMGSNLALNMQRHGYRVSVYDVRDGVTEAFVSEHEGFFGVGSFQQLVSSIKQPRTIMMMIKAGEAVDEVIDKLLPFLDDGDVIVDGGNSHFQDTARRTAYVEKQGKLFVGTGVSGGEEGALRGPSMMPGGSVAAWPSVKSLFQDICAKTDDGVPCCQWIGENGAGHFVKMVHNGIEYGDMQIICEAYQIMKDLLKMDNDSISNQFAQWNLGDLNSYLIGITSEIVAFRESDGSPLLDRILDTAGQKGTGKWTAIAALDEGVPLTLITEAVFSRTLSSMKEERVKASGLISAPKVGPCDSDLLSDLKDALLASKIISYAQGFSLMRSAAGTYGWNLNYGAIALTWRGGCIIRSAFLDRIKAAYDLNAEIENIVLDPYFRQVLEQSQSGWRRLCSAAILNGIPVPAMTSALQYFDGYRSERLPANLLQAQRDYFGAHTYERTDAPRGRFFHTDWTKK